MALDSLLIKVRYALTTVRSNIPASPRPTTLLSPAGSIGGDRLGVLAFETASLMSKTLYLWRALSDAQLLRLHRHCVALPGVRKLVSDDDAFLLSLARAEFADTLRAAANAISSLAARCADPALRRFPDRFRDFADSGQDLERWVLTRKEMETKAKKMDKYVATTAALYKQMDELAEREQYLRRLLHHSASAATVCNIDGAGQQKSSGSVGKMAAVADVQQRVLWQRQEVKHLKEVSLWNRSFDTVAALLARSAFTILARIKHVFCFPIPCADDEPTPCSPSPPFLPLATPPQSPRPSSVSRTLSQSAVVHPSSDAPDLPSSPSPTRLEQLSSPQPSKEAKLGFFRANAAALEPPNGTLGAAGLAPRYANVIVILEKMVRCPRSIGPDARDDLYAMLPSSVRAALRAKLRGVASCAATDVGLAEEWRAALGKIVEWLAPIAHNTLRWQAERSFERRSAAASAQRSGVLLLQTLHFACRDKTEATVVELLVGLNYVWRFEMEMSAKAAAAAFFAAAQAGDRLKESTAEIVLL